MVYSFSTSTCSNKMFASSFVRQGKRKFSLLLSLSMAHQQLTFLESTKSEERQAKEENSSSENDQDLFENQCLTRQLYRPKIPYPAWDYNWDGNETTETSLAGIRQGLDQQVKGKSRHIILVRHGQYDESFPDDEHQTLTPLGRLQAIRTGKRLREMMEGAQGFEKERSRGPCLISAIRVSNMERAKETANLIAHELGLKVQQPDPDLNEGYPAPMIPIRPDLPGTTEDIDQNHDRIERAFQRYFYRDMSQQRDEETQLNKQEQQQEEEEEVKDDFEIIVCHGTILSFWLPTCILPNCNLTVNHNHLVLVLLIYSRKCDSILLL